MLTSHTLLLSMGLSVNELTLKRFLSLITTVELLFDRKCYQEFYPVIEAIDKISLAVRQIGRLSLV